MATKNLRSIVSAKILRRFTPQDDTRSEAVAEHHTIIVNFPFSIFNSYVVSGTVVLPVDSGTVSCWVGIWKPLTAPLAEVFVTSPPMI